MTPMGTMALEDKEVKQADFLSSSLPMQLPKVAQAADDQRSGGRGDLADDPAGGDPDRPRQLPRSSA